jgi:hypothetical protein
MLILPATRVLGSQCPDLGTVGEGQGRLTGGNGAVWLAEGMAWGKSFQSVNCRSLNSNSANLMTSWRVMCPVRKLWCIVFS